MVPTCRVMVLSLVLSSSGAKAYTENIHEFISESAAAAWLVREPESIERLGLDTATLLSTADCPTNDIPGLIACGARSEDLGIRPLRHFLDPQQHNRGLNDVIVLFEQTSSVNWALEDTSTYAGQDHSYRDAERQFFDAMTATSASASRTKLGQMFQSLGHVIHHIQDMAQPQHVRDDQHCTFENFLVWPWEAAWWCGGFLYDPSLMESYAREQETRLRMGTLPIEYYVAPGGSVAFATARQYWISPSNPASNVGMAAYTSRNFISSDTNFRGLPPSFAADPEHPLPSPTATVSSTESSSALGLPGPNQQMRFLSYTYQDPYDSRTVINSRLTTFSIFDDHLRTLAAPNLIFSFNQFNAETALEILLPRAQAFSSGLLQRFFRGDIELIPPTSSDKSHWRIKNNGPEALSGELWLTGFYEDAKQEPHRQVATFSVGPGATSAPFEIHMPTNPTLVEPSTYESRVYVVFRGLQGAEGDATPTNSDFYSVVARQQTTPTPPVYTISVRNTGNEVIRLNSPQPGQGIEVQPGQFVIGSYSNFPHKYTPAFGGVERDSLRAYFIGCNALHPAHCSYEVTLGGSIRVGAPAADTTNCPLTGILNPYPANGVTAGTGNVCLWDIELIGSWPN